MDEELRNEELEQAMRDASDGLHVAIIKDANFGLRDFPNGKPGLWFVTEWGTSGSLCALQCFQGQEIERILIEARVYQISDLNGRQCLVRTDFNRAQFEGFLKEVEGTCSSAREEMKKPIR